MKTLIKQSVAKSLLVLAMLVSFPSNAIVRPDNLPGTVHCDTVYQRLEHDSNGNIVSIDHYYICEDGNAYIIKYPVIK